MKGTRELADLGYFCGAACNNRAPVQKHAKSRPTTKTMARIDKPAAIDKAVDAIKKREFTDYPKAAGQFKCLRRDRGLTKSRREANSFWHQSLTIEQKEFLIHRVNHLTD
jgi:hypothetical protein